MDTELMAMSEVTDEDIDEALSEWEQNPPDPDYAAILIAEGMPNAAD